MRGSRQLLLLAAVLCARVAAAHSISDELSGGGTQPTSGNPASYYVGDRLAGAFELRHVTLRPAFTYTHAFSSPAPAGANFSTSDANIYFIQLGVDVELGKHWELGVEGNGSPPAASATDTPIDYTATINKQTMQLQADGQLQTSIASAGGTAWFSYDTAGDEPRRVEGTFELGVAPTEYFLESHIAAVWNKKQGAPVATSTLQQSCAAMAARCPQGLAAALQGVDDKLFQARIWGSATATIRGHTDVSLDGAYYVYDRDPTQVGYITLGAAGRSNATELGNGLPIAPLRGTVRAGVTTRFANMSFSASFGFGEYVSDQLYSYDLSLGLRIQYKLTDHWKLWLRGTGQRDVDSTGAVSYGGLGALGLRATF